ncbi:lipopolysaccharide biosynthesis protein [Pseudoduganella sp. OTU4001]|uniref:lipopolysaccharide biosynthesis protein n=1 Tax=Pseudoduganella sp. OTU4001 TaxID=3043854 RepID=UPI00313BAA7B
MNLQAETARGVKWVAGAKLASQLITWVVTIVVMRLLVPGDYGLLAMATVLLGLLSMFSEVGLGPALVQRRDVSDQEMRQALSIIWIVNLALCLLANLLAPQVAAFYHEARLQSVVHVLSLQFLLVPLTVLPDVRMQRRLEYRQRSLIELTATLAASGLTLLLALQGVGVWALVGGALIGVLWRAVALNICAPGVWRPSLALGGMRHFLLFGGSVTGTRLLWYGFNQMDVIIVGRLLGEQQLGLYAVSMHLASLPLQRITAILNQVLFPALARAQEDLEAIRSSLLVTLGYVGLVAFPVLWGMASVAPELVAVVLGPGWEGAVLPLQALCVIMPFRSLIGLLPTVTDALGHPGAGFRNMLLASVVMPPAFYIGAQWGVAGVALAWLMVYPFVMLINMRRLLGVIGISSKAVLRRTGPAIACAALMLAAVTLLRPSLAGAPRLHALVLEIAAGVLAYGACSFLFNRSMLGELKQMMSRSTVKG